MKSGYTENRNRCNSRFAECVIYHRAALSNNGAMMNTEQLLRCLDEKGVRNSDIAKTLGLSPSRITEIKKGERRITLDEAAKLAQAYELEQGHPVMALLPLAVGRLVIRYIAAEMGAQPSENQVEELTADVRAFATFVADPKVRQSVEAAEGFFHALRIRRPESEPAAPPRKDPALPN